WAGPPIINRVAQELVAPGYRPAGTPGTTSPSPGAAPLRKRVLPEVLLVGLGYLVYSQVRGLAGDRVSDAFANARQLIDIERDLGIYAELTWQRWVLPHATLVDVFNIIYFYSFFPVIIPTAIW